MNDYGFVFTNDSLQTYHSSPRNQQPQEMNQEQQSTYHMEGETAPDVTFFPEASLVIRERENTKILQDFPFSYEIDLCDCIDPLRPLSKKESRTEAVSWNKVDWSELNTIANDFYDNYLEQHVFAKKTMQKKNSTTKKPCSIHFRKHLRVYLMEVVIQILFGGEQKIGGAI